VLLAVAAHEEGEGMMEQQGQKSMLKGQMPTRRRLGTQCSDTPRRGFTLTELLVVMLVLSILTAMAWVGLSSALNDARASRTKTVINKIDTLIQERWEGYRTRAVPLPRLQNQNAIVVARSRLYVLRELMRMEMPDRRTDVLDDPVIPGLAIPALTQSYRRLVARWTTNWTRQHQGAECLYLILATMKDGDKSALDYFSTDEVGDSDGDGMKEILDGWGRPIEFLRWAPAYAQHPGSDGQWGVASVDDDGNGTTDDIFEAGYPGSDDLKDSPITQQTRIAVKHPTRTDIPFAPDPYDPLKTDPRWSNVNTAPYALHPLIFSAGMDGSYDVATVLEDPSGPSDFRYSQTSVYVLTSPPNDPYFVPPTTWTGQFPLGTVGDIDGDGYAHGWADNITNHDNRAQ